MGDRSRGGGGTITLTPSPLRPRQTPPCLTFPSPLSHLLAVTTLPPSAAPQQYPYLIWDLMHVSVICNTYTAHSLFVYINCVSRLLAADRLCVKGLRIPSLFMALYLLIYSPAWLRGSALAALALADFLLFAFRPLFVSFHFALCASNDLLASVDIFFVTLHANVTGLCSILLLFCETKFRPSP